MRRTLAVLCGLGACLLAACLVTGCSSGQATAGATCGNTHTAAGVPVVIKVAKGSVNCKTALQVENEYAARISGGQVPGNGGGAPVVVSGWTCQGYDTPEVLRTGNASQCHSGGNAILAVLPVPDATQTAALGTGRAAEQARPVVLAADGAGQAAHRVQAPGRADHLHLVTTA